MMMLGLGFDAWITLVTVIAVMAVLLFTRLRSDVIFLGAIGILFVPGVLDTSEAFSGFVNSSVIIVGIMFVIVSGLSHTGALQQITKPLLGKPKGEVNTLLHLMLPVALLSIFVNNTSVVAIFVRVIKLWSKKLDIQASKLLIPLSYAGVMGGAIAAIATPTTLLLCGMYEKQTGQPLSIFASTLPALACFVVGTLALIVFRRLLPAIKNPESAFENTSEYTLEMLVTSNNRHIGKTIGELELNRQRAGSLVELIHFDDERLVTPVSDDEPLIGGDRLLFAGHVDELMGLAKEMGFVSPDYPVFSISDKIEKRQHKTAYICFGSNLIERRLCDTTFEQDYEMTLMAVSRKGERINEPPREVVLQTGDLLLFVHKPHKRIDTDALKSQLHFIDSLEDTEVGLNALVSTAILIGMVLLSVTGVMPLLQSAFLAAGAMLVFGCCTPSQAMNSINCLALCGSHPLLVMIALCLMAAFVTEFVSNSAALALMFPVFYDAAMDIGCNPLPFAISLLLAVNAAFLTPISTPLNLLVYGPGGYRPTDYLRIGLPVKLAYLITSIIVISLIYDV